MRVKLFGVDLSSEKINEFELKQSIYNYEFSHYIDYNQLVVDLKSEFNLVVVAIDLKRHKKQKYILSAQISKLANVEVIFISNKTNEDERVRWAISYGSLIYINKPYKCEELITKTLLISEKHKSFLIGNHILYLDLKLREIFYLGEPIKSTPKLFSLMLYFIENDGQIVKRDEIMTNVFGEHYLTDRSIDNFVKDLRKRINPDIVHTVRGVGYRFDSQSLNWKREK